MKKLELLSDIKNGLGEGPYYHSKTKNISWVDIINKKLYILDEKNNIKEVLFPEKIGAAIPLNSGDGYIACCESKLFLYKDNKITEYVDISSISPKGMRSNDAKVDALGRLYFSIINDSLKDSVGALYVYDKGKIKLVIDDVLLGNGMAWNHDNTKFYFNDSGRRECYSFDYNLKTGALSNKKVLFKIDDIPDGMSIDNDDNLFIALWGESRLEIRDSKTGALKDIINLPTKLVTSCTFASDNYDELIITTASLDEKDEYAGKVFKLKLDDYIGREEKYFLD